MLRYSIFMFILLFTIGAQEMTDDAETMEKIYTKALEEGKCYQNLRELCKDIGPRLSGSEEAAQAVAWAKKTMENMGMKVSLQEVMVPHWVRGDKEVAEIVGSKKWGTKSLNICALGGSIATKEGGIQAEIIEVHQFSDLEKLGEEKIKGKIVFFNRPMKATNVNAFMSYAEAVNQRTRGAAEAAKYGAVGVFVRSMNLKLDDYPHTGTMSYQEEVTKIPAAAVSTNDAELLRSLLNEEGNVTVKLTMSCQTLPDAKSYNVIGEVTGSEFPDEIIVVGGHLDSWDLAEGAHDDGAGCVQAMEVVHVFQKLEIKPKRTIRVVLFMNEENGLRGALKYAEIVKEKNELHIAALESDAGGFTPRGFSIDTNWDRLEAIHKWQPLFSKYDVYAFFPGRSGADIGPLKNDRITLIGFRPDSQRYFDYHHAATDVFEAVNKRELELGSATITSLVYLIDKYGLK